jgi:two-component system sensor histidine kinase GlrK
VSVARQLWLALGLNAALLLVVVVEHARTIEQAVTTAHELSEVSAQIVLSQAELAARLSLLEETAEKYAVTRDTGYLLKLAEVSEDVRERLDALPRGAFAEREAIAFDSLRAVWSALRVPGVEASLARPRRPGATITPELTVLLAGLADTRARSDELAHAAQATMRERLATSSRASERAQHLSWAAAGSAFLLVGVTVVLLRRAITAPLASIMRGTRTVASGDFAHRLTVRGPGEFAEVANAFNHMIERLGQLDRLKRDFVTTVSHDLKSPLASLRETTALLLDEVPGPLTPAQQRVLVLQRESADRLGRMIAKLLDLSRLEAGMPPVREHVPVQALLRQAAEHASAAGRPRGVCVTAETTPDTLTLDAADADQIRQVVDNLLENAVKFSPEGATVEVTGTLRTPPPGEIACLDLRVADRGPGVAPEDRTRIFERFVQTASGRGVANRGAGIGLTICREVVHAHGGHISVEVRDGGGSVFRVLLPGASAATRAPHPASASRATPVRRSA